MRTWMVIYEEFGEVKLETIMAKNFEEVVDELRFLARYGDIKGVFEVAR